MDLLANVKIYYCSEDEVDNLTSSDLNEYILATIIGLLFKDALQYL